MAALLALSPRVAVPGHGDPVDRAFLITQQAELAEVAELCRAALAGEHTEAEVLARSPYPPAHTLTALARARGT
ncbi:MAG: hypothetical protein M3Z25_19075 [Actinomycetota bacterium]|nr:hypothetical protein [Actinomycetota bacterium]